MPPFSASEEIEKYQEEKRQLLTLCERCRKPTTVFYFDKTTPEKAKGHVFGNMKYMGIWVCIPCVGQPDQAAYYTVDEDMFDAFKYGFKPDTDWKKRFWGDFKDFSA